MRDRELVTEAIRKAGGQKTLAATFGVSQSAISEWGRTRPIPRHVRPRLEDYLREIEALDPVGDQQREKSAYGQGGLSPAVTKLLALVGLTSGEESLAALPNSARGRYEERANELLASVRRQLEEYLRLLETEHQRKPRSRKKGRKRPEL